MKIGPEDTSRQFRASEETPRQSSNLDLDTDYFPKQTAKEYAQEEDDYANMHWKLLDAITAPIKNYFSKAKEHYSAAKIGTRANYQIMKLGPKPFNAEKTRQAFGIITRALDDLKNLKTDFALQVRADFQKQQEDFKSTLRTQQFETAQVLKKEISQLQKTQRTWVQKPLMYRQRILSPAAKTYQA